MRFKPTLVNMDVLTENLQFNDFIHEGNWNFSQIQHVFSDQINPIDLNHGLVDVNCQSLWGWSGNFSRVVMFLWFINF